MTKFYKKKVLVAAAILSSLLVPFFNVYAQAELDCSNAPIKSASCKDLDQEENPCPKNYIPCDSYYCEEECESAETAASQGAGEGCCCEVGENTREIRIGRLMDKTEWLADEIIREAKAVVKAAEGEISAARSLYAASGQCRAEHCDHHCVRIPLCNDCQCWGCAPEENLAAPGECDDDDPSTFDCKGVVEPECAPQSMIPKIFTETYATLIPTTKAQAACIPEEPSNLVSVVDGMEVQLSWEQGSFDYGLCDDGTCNCLEGGPRFLVEYKIGATPSWQQAGWQRETRLTLELSDPVATYQWRVAQINVTATGGATAYSDPEYFSLSPDLTPGNPRDLRSEYVGNCLQRLSWEPGAHNCSPGALACLEEPHFRLQWRRDGEATWHTMLENTTATQVDFSFQNTGTLYEWQVQQFNGYENSGWSSAQFVAQSLPIPPDFTGTASAHTITVFTNGEGDPGCNPNCPPPGCNMSDCNSFQYNITLVTTSSAVEALGGPTTLSSGWFSGSTYTFDCAPPGIHAIYSDTDYAVYINMRNGCGIESGNEHQFSLKTDSLGGCSNTGECPPGLEPAPSNCGIYWGTNGCVPPSQCPLEMRTTGCTQGTTGLPGCEAGLVCCGYKIACMNSCPGYSFPCPDGVSCLGDCEAMGKTCCCNIPPSHIRTCRTLECGGAQPNCCCETVYWACYDETGAGCFGSPCPGNIGDLVRKIEDRLHEIETHRKNIDELYDRMKKEVPAELAVVEERLEACFFEAGTEEAAARGEVGMIYLIDCQNALREYQRMYTYLPERGEGFHRGERTQEDPSFGVCWGNDYCKKEAQVANEDDDIEKPRYPWDPPCAEDFYCCIWR